MQELPQPPKLCVSSSFKLRAGVSNNTKEVIAIQSFAKSPREAMQYRPEASGMILKNHK
jgi:hypothetical protein